MADLSVATVAAFAPDDFQVKVCDEHISGVDFDASADFVGITGKVSQWGRMQAIAAEFRRRGKTVIIGGPYASLAPETVRPHCDILIRGEMEEIAPKSLPISTTIAGRRNTSARVPTCAPRRCRGSISTRTSAP
jgi:hypothetical protein